MHIEWIPLSPSILSISFTARPWESQSSTYLCRSGKERECVSCYRVSLLCRIRNNRSAFLVLLPFSPVSSCLAWSSVRSSSRRRWESHSCSPGRGCSPEGKDVEKFGLQNVVQTKKRSSKPGNHYFNVKYNISALFQKKFPQNNQKAPKEGY